jgi:hypothetical protein
MKFVIIFVLFLFGWYFLFANRSLSPSPNISINKTQSTETCVNISKEQAIKIVSNQPEVYDFMNQGVKNTPRQKSTPKIEIDDMNISAFVIHVFTLEEYYGKSMPTNQTTFNWYTIDKCRGEVICSFFIYKEGKIMRASEPNEYPC